MKIIVQSIVSMLFVAAISFYWWQQETTAKTQPVPEVDAVRLSLSGATVYQFDENGAQKTVLQAQEMAKLKNGDTNFYNPLLQNKEAGKIWQVRADFAQAKKDSGLLLLQNQVLATETVADEVRFSLQTSKLIYDRAHGVAQTDVPVLLTTPESQTRAVGLVWQVAEKIFILKQQIRSNYAPAS